MAEVAVDVNELLRRVWLRAPRGRWLAVDTDFYGPHFSLSAFVGIDSDTLREILAPHHYLHWLQRGGWLHRARTRLTRRRCPWCDGDFPLDGLEEPTKSWIEEEFYGTKIDITVVWWYIDPVRAPPDNVQPGDMVAPKKSHPMRRGWYSMDDEQRDVVTAAVREECFGSLAPPDGWPSQAAEVLKLRALSGPAGGRRSTSARDSLEAPAGP
eukprot:CAMPEP_0119269124 /NCGR_PEP_ID=MMETSP1329-20130426/6653_1 /TAXON_ID=114041 /ORGANISM="Genus nov. species nov., Strain RCC1024" /LENGTH=210 /DNA_ID=CAMNT_0007269117 /DNA_START=171 /DNA_END=800 /DNA_ORIENTATION=+